MNLLLPALLRTLLPRRRPTQAAPPANRRRRAATRRTTGGGAWTASRDAAARCCCVTPGCGTRSPAVCNWCSSCQPRQPAIHHSSCPTAVFSGPPSPQFYASASSVSLMLLPLFVMVIFTLLKSNRKPRVEKSRSQGGPSSDDAQPSPPPQRAAHWPRPNAPPCIALLEGASAGS